MVGPTTVMPWFALRKLRPTTASSDRDWLAGDRDLVHVHATCGQHQFGECSATRTELQVQDPSQPRVNFTHHLSRQFAEPVV